MLNHLTFKITTAFAVLASVGIFVAVALVRAESGMVYLSQGEMERLIAGEKFTRGEKGQDQEGEFCDCDGLGCDENGFPCEQKYCIFRPDWYTCEPCDPGEPKYYKFRIYLWIESWCECDEDNVCRYHSQAYGPADDCEFPKGTTC